MFLKLTGLFLRAFFHPDSSLIVNSIRIAKCITYLTLSNGVQTFVNFMKIRIEMEIPTERKNDFHLKSKQISFSLYSHLPFFFPLENTGTCFRGNNLSTKCFSIYAKVVGLPYLWDTVKQNFFLPIITFIYLTKYLFSKTTK